MTHRRTIQQSAGPLFRAMRVLVTAALALTPVVAAVGAIDPTPTPSASPAPAPDPSPSFDPTPTPTPCGSSLAARINAASAGSTLDLTGCTYTTGATVNKALTIVGGTLRFPTGTTGVWITHNDVTIDGMTIIGTQYAHWAEDYAILAEGTQGSPLTGVVIRNTHISSVGKTGIQTKHTSGSVISNNTVEDAAYSGIVAFSAIGGSISGNTVRRIGYTIPAAELPEGSDAYGILVNDQGGAPSSDVMVSGNTVEDVPTWHGIDTHGGLRITFRDNIIRRCRRGLFITGSPTSGAHATAIIVTGNQILAPGLPEPTTAVTLATVDGATFTGNTISGWGPNSPTSAQPWFDYLGQSTGLTASSNTVTR